MRGERFFVYILRFPDGKYYVGHTQDLRKKIAEHRKPETPSAQRNAKLEFAEFAMNSREAEDRQKELESWIQENNPKIFVIMADFRKHMREFGLNYD